MSIVIEYICLAEDKKAFAVVGDALHILQGF